MFSAVITNIRMGVTAAKPSAILWGVLYYFIAAVLLFPGVSKIFDPSPVIETMKADLLSTFELSSTDTGTFNPHQAAIAWQSENIDLSLAYYLKRG